MSLHSGGHAVRFVTAESLFDGQGATITYGGACCRSCPPAPASGTCPGPVEVMPGTSTTQKELNRAVGSRTYTARVADQSGRPDLHEVAQAQPPFASWLGMRLTFWSEDLVEGELQVRPELTNRNGVLHGGALMGFADNLGGTASFLNLGSGDRATTIESKTNFFRPVAAGTTATGRCVRLHHGRRTSVWQTSVMTEDGKLAAVITQTQLIVHD